MITKRNWSRRVDLVILNGRGVQLLKGGGGLTFFVVDGGDYICMAELVDSPGYFCKC